MKDNWITKWFENYEAPQIDDAPEPEPCCVHCGLIADKELDLISINETIYSSEFGIRLCNECFEEIKKDYRVEREGIING